jgi:putative ABC transport system permease protein
MDPRRVDAWIAEQLDRSAGFGLFTHGAVARLRDGATVADARSEMNALMADLGQVYSGSALALSLAMSASQGQMRSTAITLKEATVGSIANALWILLASVGLVLLVACANVADLFLVRSEARQREVAVRRALGAGRRGIACYFLSERALFSILGSVVASRSRGVLFGCSSHSDRHIAASRGGQTGRDDDVIQICAQCRRGRFR